MKRTNRTWVRLALVLLWAAWLPVSPARSAPPGELNRRAYLLTRQAAARAAAGDEQGAFSVYREALDLYEGLAREYPDWNPVGVGARLEQTLRQARELGDRLYPLPEGALELGGQLVREGNRYQVGAALADSVEDLGEDRFEVRGFTVELLEAGLRRAVRCNCPDFKYRGAKFGYPCRHVWAVLISRGLLPPNPEP